MRIALTQSPGRLEGLEARLAARGHEVVRSPLLEVRFRDDEATRAEARTLLALPWLLFASRSSVEAWARLGLPLAGTALGAVGEGTAAAIERAGGRVRVLGSPATGAGLARAFLARRDARGPVALPLGTRSRADLRDALVAAGLEVRRVTVYETHVRAWNADDEVDAVVLASPSAAHALPEHVATNAALVAIGPTTGRTLARRGLPARVAARPDVQALVDAIDALATERKP